MSSIHAIVLAGGEGKRMGRIDKAQVRVGGVRLLDAVLDQLPGPEMLTVVSPRDKLDLPEGVRQVSEKPAFGGPVAGIAEAFDDTCRYTMVLPTDAPDAPALIAPMYHHLRAHEDADVVAIRDAEGVVQPLCSLWRTPALRAALDAVVAAHGGSRDAAAKELLANATVTIMEGTGEEADYDTLEELAERGEVRIPESEN